MGPIEKIQNVSRGILQKWGPRSTRRNLWNTEFANGRWDYIDSTPSDCVYSFLTIYLRGGSLLDLGCGSGNTGAELEAKSYSTYTGVDISDVAIEKAKERSARARRAGRNRYVQADIIKYVPATNHDVILFRESLFYVPLARTRIMLYRCRKYLKPGGVIIVRMCDRDKYSAIIRMIESNFQVVEKHSPTGTTSILLVFR
jgi:2-polyprenyl-3-methyl-5-hydroxy-6-metoxy-1,4-benzoquinol methylase